jgi:hypothetical protein
MSPERAAMRGNRRSLLFRYRRRMRKVLAAVLLLTSTVALGNDQSYRSVQSGSATGGTPLYDNGIHGEGQIIAFLDTGVDYRVCYFAEADGSAPPVNTWTAGGGLAWTNINLNRRKIIAYDFLYSCDQFPGLTGCDDPNGDVDRNYDNNGHGTHTAASAVGDRGTPGSHDNQDALALASKMIVQDAGLLADNCTQRPGIGCPVNMTPILDQAYKQGARIHSNSWGDYQSLPGGSVPTANYSESARQVDAFVAAHPDMLVIFNTGNLLVTPSAPASAPASSLSAPGDAKNTLQVGGTRTQFRDDRTLSEFILLGPTRDGRIKPDVVGPAWVVAGDSNSYSKSLCAVSLQPGTSYASPTIAGAAALVRQYYTDGYYPSGVATPANRMTPSAALLKATIIAAARPALTRVLTTGEEIATLPTPSYEQGFGFPVLDNALYFPGDKSRLRMADVPDASGLAQGDTATIKLNVNAGTPLKATLVWTDPAGVARPASDPTMELVNDLDLRVVTPSGTLLGNETLHPGQADRLNNVEGVTVSAPASGSYTVTVSANRIGSGPRQGYALVLTGDFTEAPSTPARRRIAGR